MVLFLAVPCNCRATKMSNTVTLTPLVPVVTRVYLIGTADIQ